MAQVIDKQAAYDLIDQLQPEQVPAAVSFLKCMVSAPVDDEPVTEEDLRRLREVRASITDGSAKTYSMEEVLADFGLTMDDFPLKDNEGHSND
jgi:hypothetical protein